MELDKTEPTTRYKDPRTRGGVGLISRNGRKEQGSGHASETGEEQANIPCPWPKPGEGVIRVRYARASRERGRVCVYVWSPGAVQYPLAGQKEENLKASGRSKTKGIRKGNVRKRFEPIL
jgi:hypothetical protein